MKTILTFIGVCGVLVPQSAASQQRDVVDLAERCRIAVTAATGQRSSLEHLRGVRVLSACGSEGGAVLGAELKRLRYERDAHRLLEFYAAAAELRDAAILEAALDVAADRSSSENARIVAFKVFVAYQEPSASALPVSHFMPGNLPVLLSVYDIGQREGTPLPAGWNVTAGSLLKRIAGDASEGETMVHAARRALFYFH